MKKLIALLLAVAMMATLFAGCGSSSSDTEAASSTEPEAAEEAEEPEEVVSSAEEDADIDTDDFVWNGQMEVWSVLPTTGAEGLVMINDAMGAVMTAEGFNYVKKDSEGNPANQVQFIQQAIAAGNVGCLMVAAMSVELLKDDIQDAINNGIAVVYLGAQPTDYTIGGCVYTAYELTGMYAVLAAEYWVQTSGGNVPQDSDGKYEVAVDDYYDIADGVYRSNAVVGTIDESDILTCVSETQSYGDNATTTAFNNAQAVLNANPNCHIFIAYEPEEAMGIANAVADYCDQNGYDLADYCVIPCYAEDTTFMGLYADAETDPSSTAIKGYATYGDSEISFDDAESIIGAGGPAIVEFAESLGLDVVSTPLRTGAKLAEELLGICGFEGYYWTYGETYYDTITAVTVDGYSAFWSMGDDNPAAKYKTT